MFSLIFSLTILADIALIIVGSGPIVWLALAQGIVCTIGVILTISSY